MIITPEFRWMLSDPPALLAFQIGDLQFLASLPPLSLFANPGLLFHTLNILECDRGTGEKHSTLVQRVPERTVFQLLIAALLVAVFLIRLVLRAVLVPFAAIAADVFVLVKCSLEGLFFVLALELVEFVFHNLFEACRRIKFLIGALPLQSILLILSSLQPLKPLRCQTEIMLVTWGL